MAEISGGGASETMEDVVRVAKTCGQMILENGGETYRAEEIVTRICRSRGFEDAEIMAFPTGLMLSLKNGDETASSVQRVKKRGINLSRVDAVNRLSREYIAGKLTSAELAGKLEEDEHMKETPPVLMAVIAALSTAGFAVLYGGNLLDGCAALLSGFLIQLLPFLTGHDFSKCGISIIGGAVIALSAVAACSLFPSCQADMIIVGGMMPLLPGIPLTNAIRDIISGDLLSGSARLNEALLIALSLAAGVGVVFAAYIMLGGTIL